MPHQLHQHGDLARVEVPLDRDRRVLSAPGVWWEPGVAAPPARRRALRRELEALTRLVGA